MGQTTQQKPASRSSFVCPESLKDVTELAEYLNLPASWVYKNRHRLPHRKAGKYLRFCREEVERWFKEQQEEAR